MSVQVQVSQVWVCVWVRVQVRGRLVVCAFVSGFRFRFGGRFVWHGFVPGFGFRFGGRFVGHGFVPGFGYRFGGRFVRCKFVSGFGDRFGGRFGGYRFVDAGSATHSGAGSRLLQVQIWIPCCGRGCPARQALHEAPQPVPHLCRERSG